MKKLIVFLLCLLLISCNKYSFDNEDVAKANSEQVFGVSFPSDQDWKMTSNSSITVNTNLPDIVKTQILVSSELDSLVSLKILNEAKGGTITFDIPNEYNNLYVAFINSKGQYFYKKFNIDDTNVEYTVKSLTRGDNEIVFSDDLVISETVESFANQRGWLPGEVFYNFNYRSTQAEDYSTEFKTLFNDIIFHYFPNGRKYNNLSQIKKSGYYNESCYPITTGEEPIIVSPVYKNDGGYHEISEADLYYYYYKGNNLTTTEIEALPKYRAVSLGDIYSNSDNGNIAKTKSYTLVYWGDGIPTIGTKGSYQFPKGYKIGFMYKSNTTYESPKKQGELYGDGRLNYNINSWGNFKSSKLNAEEPRMAWMSVNDKMFLCIESGTDTDFNDLIVEVEGGIEPIIVIPDPPEYQSYMFCFEDHRLGDYDMNDVVIKGERINETHVKYTLMACGASDDLYLHNINGSVINKNTEVHSLLNRPQSTFINTTKGDKTPYISDIITVSKDFSFLDADTQPYIYNATKGWEVKVARKGQDPHAIMIPYDFKWPLEKVCIKDAYLQFNGWGVNLIEETEWYKFPVLEKVY